MKAPNAHVSENRNYSHTRTHVVPSNSIWTARPLFNALTTQVTYGGFLLRVELFTRKHFKDATFVSKGDEAERIQIWFYRFSCHILSYVHTEARNKKLL